MVSIGYLIFASIFIAFYIYHKHIYNLSCTISLTHFLYSIELLESATRIPSQFLEQAISSSNTVQETLQLNEKSHNGHPANIPCRSVEYVTQTLISLTDHMHQNQETHEKDCFCVQNRDDPSQEMQSMSMSAFALGRAMEGETSTKSGKSGKMSCFRHEI